MENRILGVGNKFPDFKLKGVVSLENGKEFSQFNQEALDGKWSVLFFWPLDFTFVCPTEIAAFNERLEDFKERDAQVFGLSTDSEFVHLAWRRESDELRDLKYPMLADNKKHLSTQLGILHPEELVPLRATYIVDPDRIIRWVTINDLNVGRNVAEVLRTIDALQTDELCPCNWERGQETLNA